MLFWFESAKLGEAGALEIYPFSSRLSNELVSDCSYPWLARDRLAGCRDGRFLGN